MNRPKLPLELILHIVDATVDFGNHTAIAFPANNWRTRLLTSWLLVSKTTNELATRLLYRHCLYLDSERRLMLLVRTLSPHSGQNDHAEDSRAPHPRPHRQVRYMTRLYLAPFSWHSLDNQPASIWIFELLAMIGPYLERLVLDLPFDSLHPWYDHLGVYGNIRAGLERLENLRELTFGRDDTFLLGQPGDWAFAEQVHSLWWSRYEKLEKLAMTSLRADLLWRWKQQAASIKLPPRLRCFVLCSTKASFEELVFQLAAEPTLQDPLRVIQLSWSPVQEPAHPVHQRFQSVERSSRQKLSSVSIPLELYNIHWNEFDAFQNPDENFILHHACAGTLWDESILRHNLRMWAQKDKMA